MKPTDTMTDETKPESASERDEKLAAEYRETTYPGWHRSPDYHSCHKRDFIAGRHSMREEMSRTVESYKQGVNYNQDLVRQRNEDLDRQEKTILELRAALEKIADPRKLGHSEPDYQTKYYCLIHLAEETLARTGVK